MTIKILKSIVEKNNINFIIDDNDNFIKIPYNLLMEEVDLKKDGKDGELETYIENYNKCIEIKNNIKNYILGNLSEESIDKLNKDIIAIKEYKNIDIILEYIDINLKLLEKRCADLSIHLGLEEKDIDNLRLEAIEKQISSQEKVKLTDEYLDNIIKVLEETDPINPKEHQDINKDCKPLLVVAYNKLRERNFNSSYIRSYKNVEFDNNKAYSVSFTRQPLNGIINNNEISDRWIKIYEFSDDLTDYDIETIKCEVIVNVKPEKFSSKDIGNNDKWLTESQIKKAFGISGGTRLETIYKMYSLLGYGYENVRGTYLYNKRLYDKAEKVYTEVRGKKIKYEYK